MAQAPKLSKTEIAALCTRAARGAGHEWGVAQEAGHAAARLSALGLPGTSLLAKLLRQTEEGSGQPCRPDPERSRFTTPDRPLCALLTGCYVSDLGAGLFAYREVAFGPVLVPGFLAGFVTPEDIAPDIGISLIWQDGEIWIGPRQGSLPAMALAAGNVLSAEALEVSICPAHQPGHLDPVRADPESAGDLAFLQTLAQRTFVPESAESRARGAGESA